MVEIVIENMEEPGEWVVLEYLHAANMSGDKLIITGSNSELDSMLSLYAAKKKTRKPRTTPMHVEEYCRGRSVILLDPSADKQLEPEEAGSVDCLVIGGILGDYPRRGRTRLLRERLPWASTRNLGNRQLSIDGAVYVVLEVMSGKRLDEIELLENPVIKVDTPLGSVEIVLPFAYPVKNGEPMLAPGLLNYLVGKTQLLEH